MAPSIRSRRKRGGKAKTSPPAPLLQERGGSDEVIKRLRRIKAQPLQELSEEQATWTAKELQNAGKQIEALTDEAQRVTRLRQALLDLPSLVVPGSTLL